MDFVLIFENKIEIYNQDLIKTESIELPINAKKIKVFSKGYGFINQFGDLSIMVNGKLKIVNNVNDFEIDYYKNTLRVLVIGEKEFKLLYL